jgi:pimeloyl-ACP methyl ester carboxylesterase
MPTQEAFRDCEFEVNGLTIAGQEWGMPGGVPVIALHGWLDNAASFDTLAPLLKGLHLIALDSAGHGLSGHRGQGSAYHIWQDVGEVFAVADQLSWSSFGLLGHSRGAIISMLAAGTFPERVSHLAMLDGLFPSTVPADQAPQQLARSIIELQRSRHRGFALYPDVDTAVLVRQRSEIPVSESAARLLTRRGLMEVEDGYTWRSDPQLKLASGFKLSDEHVDAFMQRITARMLLVLAEEGIPRLSQRHEKAIAQYPQIQVERLAGGHHLHMDAAPAGELAPIVNRFFQT